MIKGLVRLSVCLAALFVVGTSIYAVALKPRAAAEVDWPLYGLNDKEQRFAELDQINSSNVTDLGLAWYHEFDTDRAQAGTPIMVDGVLYTSTAWSKVFAFDARTGKQLWSFDPQVPPETLPKTCCDATNRGVAVANGRVFVGTLDGRLVALDAKSGKPIWSIVTVDQSRAYTITGAPTVAGNVVIIGNGGAEYGERGYATAYDVATGKKAWRFYMVPNPDGKPDGEVSDKPLKELAEPTWFGDGWRKMGGGGTVWDSMTYDQETGVLYIGVGNAGPYDRGVRSDGKGDNLFVASILAVKAATGEYLWHYQETPGDSWDYTSTQHIMLIDKVIDGRPRKLLVHAPKNGFFYVLDRTNGQLISAKPYTTVNWASEIDMKTGRPVFAPGVHYEDKPFFMQPSSLGGHSWHPMAYSPKTGLVYIPGQVMAQFFAKDPAFEYLPNHINTSLDLSAVNVPDDPRQVAEMRKAVYGELIAWDPFAQKAVWRVRHPWLVNGGVLATAGNLVFQGTAEGRLVAYDASDGRELWSYPTTNGIIAPPISYRLDGKQYIAVLVGYGGPTAMYGTITPYRPRLPGRLMVFTLGGKVKPEPFAIAAAEPVDLTGVTSPGDAAKGGISYNQNCMVCHGMSATGRYTADLRRSQIIKNPEAFKNVVIDGALADNGMVSFAKFVTPEQAENIRAYLIQEAQKLAKSGDIQNWPPKPGE